MTDQPSFERRVGTLLRAIADDMPLDVDPMAMARIAAAGRVGVTTRFGFVPGQLAIALLLLALVAAMAGGALVGSRFLQPDAEDLLTPRAFVEPFTGLPPEDAAPSVPERGELVVSFGGRVNSLGLDFHRMWLYADGRLLWKSNVGGSIAGQRQRFGASEPTPAVIEQYLTPEGVDLIRSYVMARVPDPRFAESVAAGPGVLWGYMSMPDGDQIVPVTWSDSGLPSRLADPASWLPPSAWADRRIGGFVPSRYAVCLGQALPSGVTGLAPTDVWDLLPEPIRNLIRSKALEDLAPDWNEQDPRCLYQISTDHARAIVAGFDEAGLRRESDDGLSYTFPIGHEFPGIIQVLVVVPDGEVVCLCG